GGRQRVSAQVHVPGDPHLRSRSIRRSDSFLPPVWQCGQYWSDRSAKDTSAIVVPHTGHPLPARPWTENPRFFAALTFPGGRPLSACRVVVRTALMVSRGELRGMEDLVGVGIADACDDSLILDDGLDPRGRLCQAGSEFLGRDGQRVGAECRHCCDL